MNENILQCDHLSKNYEGVRALKTGIVHHKARAYCGFTGSKWKW